MHGTNHQLLSSKSGADYPQTVDNLLCPAIWRKETVLDLFAGCGGFALGFEAAGFDTIGYEANADCCATYRANLHGSCAEQFITVETEFPVADIVIGGPPCQPFSVGGHQLGLEDSRDGFPAFIAAVERLQPKLWMFENVRGLLYKNRWYLDQIIQRLERFGYVVDAKLLNASHYLVPQSRERLIVVGHKGGFKFPEKSSEVITVGRALGGFLFSEPAEGKYLTQSMDDYVAKYERASKCINPRDLDPNRPSRTITCRNLGGATGDMQRIKLPSGRRRRLTVREGARLQSFPDWFEFCGGESSQFNQVGNAVPPMFAFALAKSVRAYLDQSQWLNDESIRECWSPVQASLELI
ncbi:DNA cytosine methyltransferase [Edaphobacter sp.]|uniref:DNA cytosine methyltransferase n=1 Tax=Edaphobacter sp. TaxID=1934404 RepID=UPI002DBBFA56|nr:DNA cytosine methyltransferase [Edaphobacter sp.]HEU5341263.1 DNA cytosine methyltransferase [Edaphobacter sp.]